MIEETACGEISGSDRGTYAESPEEILEPGGFAHVERAPDPEPWAGGEMANPADGTRVNDARTEAIRQYRPGKLQSIVGRIESVEHRRAEATIALGDQEIA